MTSHDGGSAETPSSTIRQRHPGPVLTFPQPLMEVTLASLNVSFWLLTKVSVFRIPVNSCTARRFNPALEETKECFCFFSTIIRLFFFFHVFAIFSLCVLPRVRRKEKFHQPLPLF